MYTRCLSPLLSLEKFWLFGGLRQRVLRYITEFEIIFK